MSQLLNKWAVNVEHNKALVWDASPLRGSRPTARSLEGAMNPYEEIERRASSTKSLQVSAEVLEILLSGGFSVWTDGSLYSIKQLVARVNGLRIEVFSREHSPPHFHISGGGIDATFSISDCEHLSGEIGGREKALVKWWYARSKPSLVRAWNESRPSDCPVGVIEE